MAAFVFPVIVLALVGVSDAAWCICKPDQSSSALQKALDYACGAGADCSPILQNGACYNPNTVAAHCSYAANSYYQRKGQTQGACDFAGAATLTTTDPSLSGCTYPATPSAAGTSTPSTSTPPGSSTTPGTLTPPGSTLTPSTGTGGTGTGTGTATGTGGFGGLGPSGTASYDGSDGGFLPEAKMGFLLFPILLVLGLWSI